MKKALFTTALIGTLGISGIIGYAATNAEQPAANTESAFAISNDTVTLAEAQKIALQEVKGQMIKSEQDDDGFEFDIRDGDYVYEVEVQQRSGDVVKVEKDYEPQGDVTVTEAEAKEIALLKVPNGEIVKLELDHDDGQANYEVEIVKDNYEHEIEINAVTGKIVEYERDTEE